MLDKQADKENFAFVQLILEAISCFVLYEVLFHLDIKHATTQNHFKGRRVHSLLVLVSAICYE